MYEQVGWKTETLPMISYYGTGRRWVNKKIKDRIPFQKDRDLEECYVWILLRMKKISKFFKTKEMAASEERHDHDLKALEQQK